MFFSNDTNKLVEMYLESSSYVEKSQILIKLCQMKGKDFDLGGQKKVGDKLNFVLRQFTKQKDWVNFRLGKFNDVTVFNDSKSIKSHRIVENWSTL